MDIGRILIIIIIIIAYGSMLFVKSFIPQPVMFGLVLRTGWY